MAQRLAAQHELTNYYDLHATEEELMSEGSLHDVLLGYLKDVLLWLFVGQRCAVYRNLNVLSDARPAAYPLAPDLAVLKGVDWQMLSTWHTDGSLWSPQLESFLLSDGHTLRLYDPEGTLRLTHAEAEAERANVEAEAKLVALRRADAEARRADAEAEAKLVALQRVEVEAEAKLAALRQVEALTEKLRSLGIDPNRL